MGLPRRETVPIQEPAVEQQAPALNLDDRRFWCGFGIVVLAFVASLIVFPQEVFTIRDEANYVGVAQAFLRGEGLDVTKSAEKLDGLVPWIAETEGHRVPLHPIGISFAAIPFVAVFGWKVCFLLSVGVFALGGWLFKKLLEAHGVSRAYVILYLIFPPLLLYSRVYMADVPSAVLCLAGLYLLRGRPLTPSSGVWGMASLGFAFLVRPTNALFIGPLVLFALIQAARNRSWAVMTLVSGTGLLFLSVQLCLNAYYLGEPLSFSYSIGAFFGGEYFARNSVFYLTSLLCVYPLMFLALGESLRGRQYLETAIVVGGILFHSFYWYIDADENSLISLIRGQRFLLPYAVILLIFYARSLQRIPWMNAMIHRYQMILVFLGVVCIAAISYAQAQHNRDSVAAKAWVYENSSGAADEAILYNADSSEFIHGAFGDRNYHLIRSGSKFPEAFERASSYATRILVVETEHPLRRGPSYVPGIIVEGRRGLFTVEEVEEFGDIQIAVLVR